MVGGIGDRSEDISTLNNLVYEIDGVNMSDPEISPPYLMGQAPIQWKVKYLRNAKATTSAGVFVKGIETKI